MSEIGTMRAPPIPVASLEPRDIFVKGDPERVPPPRQVIAVRVRLTDGLRITGAPEGALARSLWYPESIGLLHGEFGLWLTDTAAADTLVYKLERSEVEGLLSPEALAFLDNDAEMGISESAPTAGG